MRKNKFVLLILFIAAITAARFLFMADMLTLDTVKRERDELRETVNTHYVVSVLSFIAVYVGVTALSIPGATVLTIAGGFLYGVLPAILYVNIGATLGAVFAFLAARYLLGEWLQNKYRRYLSRFNEEISRNGTSYMLTLRFIPAFPFFLINILSGFTTVRLRTFIWTTALGIIPGTAVYAYAGRQIGSINSPDDIFSARVIVAFVVLALLAIFPAVVNSVHSIRSRT